jgi:hypothetical protein
MLTRAACPPPVRATCASFALAGRSRLRWARGAGRRPNAQRRRGGEGSARAEIRSRCWSARPPTKVTNLRLLRCLPPEPTAGQASSAQGSNPARNRGGTANEGAGGACRVPSGAVPREQTEGNPGNLVRCALPGDHRKRTMQDARAEGQGDMLVARRSNNRGARPSTPQRW